MSVLVEQAQRPQLLFATEDVSLSEEVVIDEGLSSEEFAHTLQENPSFKAETCAAMSDTTWSRLYPDLRSLANYLVQTSPLPYWRGQEEDLAEDIVQETVRRVIERAQKAERGEASPIQSLKQMATTIAYNYYRDLKRHDYRLSRSDTTDASMYVASDYPVDVYSADGYPADVYSDEDVLEAVADKVDQDRLFDVLAGVIDRFPPKQKRALLMDLANRMSFDEKPTALQESFLDNGMELRHYRQSLPNDHKERSRHVSLVSQAYKRISRLYAR
jgi:RNA polymerase sigma factor (sigma-70 family)